MGWRALLLGLASAAGPFGAAGTAVYGAGNPSLTAAFNPASAAASAAQLAATQGIAEATAQVGGAVGNAYNNMARKAGRSYDKHQDTFMGLLYVDVSQNLGDPLAVCNDGSQGETRCFCPDLYGRADARMSLARVFHRLHLYGLTADNFLFDSAAAGAFYFAPATTQPQYWIVYLQARAARGRARGLPRRKAPPHAAAAAAAVGCCAPLRRPPYPTR